MGYDLHINFGLIFFSTATCPICLEPMSYPRSLTCKYSFCPECIQTALNVCNSCPVCQQPLGYIIGNHPRGQMTFYRNSVPGYEGQVASPDIKIMNINSNDSHKKQSWFPSAPAFCVGIYYQIRFRSHFSYSTLFLDFSYLNQFPLLYGLRNLD